MSNIEHLIENALTAMSIKPSDTYQAFADEMSAMYNQQMLQEVSITEDELWAIAQYIFYTWLPCVPVNTVDVVEVVRCKDCKHRRDYGMCDHPQAVGWDAIAPEDDDFCSYGERRQTDD